MIHTLVTNTIRFTLTVVSGLIHVRQTILQNKLLDGYYDKDLAAEAEVVKYR